MRPRNVGCCRPDLATPLAGRARHVSAVSAKPRWARCYDRRGRRTTLTALVAQRCAHHRRSARRTPTPATRVTVRPERRGFRITPAAKDSLALTQPSAFPDHLCLLFAAASPSLSSPALGHRASGTSRSPFVSFPSSQQQQPQQQRHPCLVLPPPSLPLSFVQACLHPAPCLPGCDLVDHRRRERWVALRLVQWEDRLRWVPMGSR